MCYDNIIKDQKTCSEAVANLIIITVFNKHFIQVCKNPCFVLHIKINLNLISTCLMFLQVTKMQKICSVMSAGQGDNCSLPVL